MQRIKKFVLSLTTLFFFFVCCSKEDVKPKELSEVLIGRWEITEAMDYFTYGDTLWHPILMPSITFRFEEKGTVTFDYGSVEESGDFSTIKNDTIVLGPPFRQKWIVLDFTENTLAVSSGIDLREGQEIKSRFAKIQ
ncbi:MAG: hypothetical protein AAGJ18_22395 [Bacteroidota bacterium]